MRMTGGETVTGAGRADEEGGGNARGYCPGGLGVLGGQGSC